MNINDGYVPWHAINQDFGPGDRGDELHGQGTAHRPISDYPSDGRKHHKGTNSQAEGDCKHLAGIVSRQFKGQ